jgi:2-C-methyl-D-erythritol 2,4-cyclodiphosphate synthase
MRIGNGFDLHPLVPGREFVLGGVKIPHEKGPAGHSDGDVLLHAIIDALLGAAALGDIGCWFPPDDPACKDIDSLVMLHKVRAAIIERNYQISNIDSVVVCEEPKLSPHFANIRETICKALELEMDQVSVKAKTAEKIGAIGKGEAISAYAVVLLEQWESF